jgi:hypothetical protein
MTAPDRIAQTLIKILAKRGRPHMKMPSVETRASAAWAAINRNAKPQKARRQRRDRTAARHSHRSLKAAAGSGRRGSLRLSFQTVVSGSARSVPRTGDAAGIGLWCLRERHLGGSPRADVPAWARVPRAQGLRCRKPLRAVISTSKRPCSIKSGIRRYRSKRSEVPD